MPWTISWMSPKRSRSWIRTKPTTPKQTDPAGGDPKGRIQSMVEEHEATSHVADTMRVSATILSKRRGLIHRVQRWSALAQSSCSSGSKQDAESLTMSLTGPAQCAGIAGISKADAAQTNAQATSSAAAGGSRKPPNLTVKSRPIW